MARWMEFLKPDVYERLCNCRCIKADLPELINAKCKYYAENGMAEFTREDALVAVLELLDCNNQNELADLTREEYDALKAGVA